MTQRRVLKTMVGFDDGRIEHVDTIIYNGKLWLVPFWRDATQAGRLIRLDSLPHENSSFPGQNFVLKVSMPKALFNIDTSAAATSGFEVLESPTME